MLEFIDGNTAVVRAAVDAGCDFFAGYPITPATSILLEAFRELVPRGGKVIQAEDEIASIGMCLAASMAGSKVLTATSGPGLSLYSETIGLAIIGEVPMVIVNTQRMGPATGGATASADGDIQFARWVTSGGYPLIALAPTDVRTCYAMTRHSFNLAERYRVPVIVLASKEIALTRQTVDLDQEAKTIPVIQRKLHSGGAYLPYAIQHPEDIPAFSPIGGEHLVRFTTSIHDETGVITRDPKKITEKLTHLERKLGPDSEGVFFSELDSEQGATDLVIAYGVAATAAKEAVWRWREQGKKVSLLVLYTLWPEPVHAIQEAARGVTRILVPEHNFGQYAREIERLVPGVEILRLGRVDGGLITPKQITERLAS